MMTPGKKLIKALNKSHIKKRIKADKNKDVFKETVLIPDSYGDSFHEILIYF